MGQEIVALKEQLSTLRRESSFRESTLMEKKELCQEQLEDTQRDFKISTEALNEQIASLKSKLSYTINLHENERMNREKLEAELKAVRSRAADAEKKVELSQTEHSEIQRTLSQEKEQQEQINDDLKGESKSSVRFSYLTLNLPHIICHCVIVFPEKLYNLQKKYSYLSKNLRKARDDVTDMEKKVEQVTQHLKENLLKQKALEQEKDQAGAHFIMQEKNMQAKICSLQEEKNEIKVNRGNPQRL